jgi:hypothetical protein
MDDASSAMEAATHVTKMQGMNQPHTMAKCPPNVVYICMEGRAWLVTDLLGEGKSTQQ